MNRREAILSTLLLGGLGPAAVARAQDPATGDPIDSPPPRPRGRSTRSRAAGDAPEPDLLDPPVAEAGDEPPPADFPGEAGRSWRNFNLEKYVDQPHDAARPESAIVEWIFRRTGSATWHGEDLAVLSAGRARLRAYHDAKTLDQVAEMVERFTKAWHDLLSVRIRIVTAADPRWRYAVFSRLTPIATGPEGQQAWTVAADDAAMVWTQMGVYQGFQPLYERRFKMINGQTVLAEVFVNRDYVAGLQRSGAAAAGFEPGPAKLKEGVELRLSPLLTYEGDALDAAIDLKATTVRRLYATKVIAPRQVGPAEMTVDVPEVSHSRLNQTVQNWPLDRTLVLSAGIVPGILLDNKDGFLNLRVPGTVPSTTELLVFVDVNPVTEAPRSSARRKSNLNEADRR